MMKKTLLFILLSFASFAIAQEDSQLTSVSSTTENSYHYIDDILVKNSDILVFRRRDSEGKDAIMLSFSEKPVIEIANDGSITASRYLFSNLAPNDDDSSLKIQSFDGVSRGNAELLQKQEKLEQQIKKLTSMVTQMEQTIHKQNSDIENLKRDLKKVKVVLVNK